MESVLQSTISALGCLDGGIYYPEPDCFESIRDLIRFLRYDNGTALARRICGERNIVQNDLVPIMKADSTADNLFDIALRLTINLTQPTAIAFNGRTPEDKDTWAAYLKVEENLKRSKLSFADQYFFEVLKEKLMAFFQKEWTDRNEEDKMVVERIFVLIRNALSIGSIVEDNQCTTWSVDSQDKVVLALLKSGLGDYIIDTAVSESDFRLIIMEVIAHIIKKREPRDIVYSDCSRSVDEKAKDEEALRRDVQMEKQKQLDASRNRNVRHSRFVGSYVVKGVKALNQENDLVVQKALKDATSLNYLNDRKVAKRKPKNRRPFDYNEKKHVSTLSVRTELKNFCVVFLQKAYNGVMRQCKDAAFGARRTLGQKNADIHYFLLEWFFMEFRRLASLPADLVRSTLGKEAFHHVQIQLDSYLESMQIERKEGRVFGLRAQYAVLAYKELLSTLYAMMDGSNEDERATANATCSHIMQMEEYRDLSSSIIRRFTPGSLSKTFLRNLVLANHTYMRLLEKCVKTGQLSKVKKRRKVRRKKKKIVRVDEAQEDQETTFDADGVWDEICEELSDIVNGYAMPSEDVSPIDVLLRVDDDVHERFAMLLVQRALRERRVSDGVGIYRAARTLWPFDGTFGTNEMLAEDEFLELRAAFFAELEEVENEWKAAQRAAYGEQAQADENIFDNGVQGDAESSENEREDDVRYEEKEIDFDFEQYVEKFVRKDVLRWYVFLLAEYESNSAELNKAILKMLHRVAFDLNSIARLFQVSLFKIFAKIGNQFRKLPASEVKLSPFYEIYEFGFHLLKKFFAYYERIGWKLVPEILFWKGAKECYEIEFGYGTFEETKSKEKQKEILWPEELDNELRTLHDEYVGYDDKPEGIDVVEFIEHNLSRERTRKQIIRQLKSLGLDTFKARVNTGQPLRGKKSTMFAPELLEQMRQLADEYKAMPPAENTCDVVDFIRSRLPEEYSRPRVMKQLKYEGIDYAKQRLKKSKSKPWPEELMTELRSIYEQYKELTHTSGDLVGYAAARLSAKKSRREISAKLGEIGADGSFLQPSKRPQSRIEESVAGELSDSFIDEDSENASANSTPSKSWHLKRVASRTMSEEYVSSDEDQQTTSVTVVKELVMQMQRTLSESFDSDSDLEHLDSHEKTDGVEKAAAESSDGFDDGVGRRSLSVENKASDVAEPASNVEGTEDDLDDEIVLRKSKRSLRSPTPDVTAADDHLTPPARKKRAVISDSDDD